MATTGAVQDAEDQPLPFDDHVHARSKRYMAQLLDSFEAHIEPHISGSPGHVQDFKGLVRARMKALAVDAAEAHALVLHGMALNGAAVEARDRLHPEGRP